MISSFEKQSSSIINKIRLFRFSYKTLFGYIAREYLFSFLVSFLFFFFLFFVNQILVIARDVLSRQVDLASTLLLIVYALPAIVALAFPFASLVGAMMAVGRFSSDNEIVAMQACGISLIWVFLPILLIALMCGGLSFVMNDYFLPIGTINYVKLYQELVFSNSELILEPFSVNKSKNTAIVTNQVHQGQFDKLLILDTNEQGQQRIISARNGNLARNDAQAGVISLDLEDVFVFNTQKDPFDYDYSHSDEITYSILLQNFVSGVHNPSPREMSSTDVYDSIMKLETSVANRRAEDAQALALEKLVVIERYRGITQSAEAMGLVSLANDIKVKVSNPYNDRSLQLYWIEYWKKFSIPAACFTLIFLGFPAGMFAKRSGRSIGFGVGFLIAAVFWGMLLAGQTLGMDNHSLPPFLLMWAPNILFFAIGVVLLIRRIYR